MDGFSVFFLLLVTLQSGWEGIAVGGEQRGCVPACLSEKLTISKEK